MARVVKWDKDFSTADSYATFKNKNRDVIKKRSYEHVVTTFMITTNTNKIPLGYEDKLDDRVRNQRYRRGNNSSDFTVDTFGSYIAYKLRLMFEDVDNIKDYLTFWDKQPNTAKILWKSMLEKTYPPSDYSVKNDIYMKNNKYTWDNFPDNDIGTLKKPKLIQDVTIFVSPEIGPTYHRLHSHIMVEIRHVGNIKINVNAIINRMRDDTVKSVWVSSIKHYWNGMGDPRTQMFNYLRKTKSDTIKNPYETNIRRYEAPDQHSNVIVNREVGRADKTYGFHLIELKENAVEVAVDGNMNWLFKPDKYVYTKSRYRMNDMSRNISPNTDDGNPQVGYGRASQFYPDWGTFPR